MCLKLVWSLKYLFFFNILLTVHHVMILGKWRTWRTILFYVFIYIVNSMFRAHRAHYQERQIVSIQPLVAVTVCRWPCRVQVGSEFPTCTQHGHRQSDSYQRLYWHNLSLLMMSTMCSKHVEFKIYINTFKISVKMSVMLVKSCSA